MINMEKNGDVWTVPLAIEQISEAGTRRAIEAPEDVRAAAAALAGVRDIPALAADFDLARRGKGVRLTGRVRARVIQNCVVSLEPVETAVDEQVELLFEPPRSIAPAGAAEPDMLDGEAAPEPIIGGKIDLGAVAIEFLVLGIDPYPRKPGVEFAPPKTEDAGAHPFAALASLKKPPGSGGS